MKRQVTSRTTLLAAIAVAGMLYAWFVLLTPAARIDQLPSGDKALLTNPFTVGCAEKPVACRVLCHARGRLRPRDGFTATLYFVQEGGVRRVSSITVGVHSQDPFDVVASSFDIQYALCKCNNSATAPLVLGVGGQRRAAGDGTFLRESFSPTNAKVFSGAVPAGRSTIAYIEGDEAIAQPSMSLPDFAARNNKGVYLVLAVELVACQ